MPQISETELAEIYAFAIDLAREAGRMLLGAAEKRWDRAGSAGSSLLPTEKENAVDLVTQTDEGKTDIEAFIRTSIQQAYPAHKFIGEETYSKLDTKAYLIDDSPTWVVDPLDGTVNYIHSLPFYCVSIALVLDLEPIIGVINAPFLQQTFSACRGKGSFLNGRALPLAGSSPIPKDAPSGCIFGFEWGKDRRDSPQGNLARKIESVVTMAVQKSGMGGKGGMVHGVRSLGSAALDLAYVAMGGLDIWWEGGCWEWDVAAGICILKEAGGLVTSANPPDSEDNTIAEVKDAHLGGRLYLAVRPTIGTEGETAREAQERVVREVWGRVRALDYTRPGI